jgi:hypothetical protein
MVKSYACRYRVDTIGRSEAPAIIWGSRNRYAVHAKRESDAAPRVSAPTGQPGVWRQTRSKHGTNHSERMKAEGRKTRFGGNLLQTWTNRSPLSDPSVTQESTLLNRARFIDRLWLRSARFTGRLWLRSARFTDRLWLRLARFIDRLWLRSARFIDRLWLRSSRFTDRLWLRSSRFIDRLWLRSARFIGRARTPSHLQSLAAQCRFVKSGGA